MTQQPTPTKRAKGKVAAIILIAAVVIAGAAYYFTADMRTYSKATAFQASGEYTAAIAAFESIPDYQDAAARLMDCKYQNALALASSMDAKDALAAFTELGDHEDSAARAAAIQAAMDEHRAELARLDEQTAALDAALATADGLITGEKQPLDPQTKDALQVAVDAAAAKAELPAAPITLADYQAATEALKAIDRTAATDSVLAATTAMASSIAQRDLITNPTEDYVIDRLSRVPDIAYLAAATEDNDPNGQLGKAGGYTAQVFFSSTLVSSAYAKMPDLDVVKAGTEAGGSVEVYQTEGDAERRSDYLADYDGTALASGSRKVVGTVLVRTSNALKASDQQLLQAEIIAALTAHTPGPVVERLEAAAAEPLVSVNEIGFSVHEGLLYYAAVIKNELADTAIQFPEFRVTARDASGNPLRVDTHSLTALYPDQAAAWASYGTPVSEVPATVEVELVDPALYNLIKPIKLSHPVYLSMEVQGAKLIKDEYTAAIVGELHNPNDYDIENAKLTALFRDSEGALVYGAEGFCQSIKAGGKVAFEISAIGALATDTYEVFAMPW